MLKSGQIQNLSACSWKEPMCYVSSKFDPIWLKNKAVIEDLVAAFQGALSKILLSKTGMVCQKFVRKSFLAGLFSILNVCLRFQIEA